MKKNLIDALYIYSLLGGLWGLAWYEMTSDIKVGLCSFAIIVFLAICVEILGILIDKLIKLCYYNNVKRGNKKCTK